MENGLCRCGYTRVETYTYTRLSTSGLIPRGWTSGSTGDYAVQGPSPGPGRPESLVSVLATPGEQREAPQGKARVERRHEGARPPPRLA